MRGCWLEIRSDQVYRLMSDLRWIILIKIISEGGEGGRGTPYNVLYTEARPEKSTYLFQGRHFTILVPRARRFLITWSGNEGLWKQPLPDVRKFLTSGRACAEVTNITAHAHNGFLSLTAPLGEKFYFLSSLQRVASLGCFENAPLHSTWIHW